MIKRSFHLNLFLLVLVVLLPLFALGQSITNRQLSSRNPDGWFTLLVPKSMGKVERHADVDGGFFSKDSFEIDYDYWAFVNTPNFLRDSRNHFPKTPTLACERKSRKTHTFRARIDGKASIIQRCSTTIEGRAFSYIYYVTFPKLKVRNVDTFQRGMFNLTVRYKNKSDLRTAERIVRSINFN